MSKADAYIAVHKTLYRINPALSQLLEIVAGAVNDADVVAKAYNPDTLEKEAIRQEKIMQMAERQAKVAQEIALAKRIETADEVEMEEFYDYSVDASVGVKDDGNSSVFGVAGKGQRISKRIVRFKGGPKYQMEKNPPST